MALQRMERFEQQLQRRRRRSIHLPICRLQDRDNPLEWFDNFEFKRRFHMYKESAVFIIELIKMELCAPVRRGAQLPPAIQFCIAARFYATGSFQLTLGDLHKVGQPSVSKVVRRVSIAIAKKRQSFISYPTPAEAPLIRAAFYRLKKFPGRYKAHIILFILYNTLTLHYIIAGA